MSSAPKSSLLDRLRTQSEALRARETVARRPIDVALRDIDRGLWRVHMWLDEALGHLEVIHPVILHQFQLDNILTLKRPRFDRGFMSFRRGAYAGVEVLTHVEMFYSLSGAKPFVVRVNQGAAAGIEDRLREVTMQFQYQTEQDEKRTVRYGLFHIQPVINATVRFQPDYARQIVNVTLRNVDRFEEVQLEFAPERLDEAALEDLVNFMLGDENGFLRRAPLAMIKARAGRGAA